MINKLFSYIAIAILLLTGINTQAVKAETFFLVGPRLNYNLGGSGGFSKKLSFGIETSVWPSPFYGIDFGLEVGNGKFLTYSEGQIGIGFLGTSFGPYFDFLKSDSKFGFQSTTWANLILGGQFRYRTDPKQGQTSWGTYLSLPLTNWSSIGDSTSGGKSDDFWDD